MLKVVWNAGLSHIDLNFNMVDFNWVSATIQHTWALAMMSIKWIWIPSSLELQSPCLPSHHRQINHMKLFKLPAWVQPHERTPHPIRIWKKLGIYSSSLIKQLPQCQANQKNISSSQLKIKEVSFIFRRFWSSDMVPFLPKNSRIQTQPEQKGLYPNSSFWSNSLTICGYLNAFFWWANPFFRSTPGRVSNLAVAIAGPERRSTYRVFQDASIEWLLVHVVIIPKPNFCQPI